MSSQSDYARLHAILDSLNEGVLMYDLNGTVIEANRAALEFLSAATKEEIILTRAGLDQAFAVSDLDGTPVPVEQWPVWRVMQGDEVCDVELLVRNKRTGRQWISSHSGKPLRFPDTDEAFGVLSVRDITESKIAEQKVQESEARLKCAFDSFIDQVIIVDQRLNTKYMNPAAIDAGVSATVDRTNAYWRSAASEAIARARPIINEVHQSTGSGSRDYMVSATPLFNAAGVIDEIVVLAHDSTEQKQAREGMRKAALQDALTGLPSRAMLYEYAKHMLSAARRLHQQVAVLFINLDRFKLINDIYGHEFGDRLLHELAARLRSRIRGEDLVARFGGDEFVILLPQIDEQCLPHAVAADILHLIRQPIRLGEVELTVEACIGISLYPRDGETLDELLRLADAAMYAVKESGRNDYRFYTEDLTSHSITHSQIEYELRRAIANGELSMAYQPIVDIDSGKVVCAEALIRWENSLVGPDVFVPIAERSGLIGPMAEWVLEEVSREQRAWRQQGLASIPIAVNVSPVQFKLRGFIEDIERRIGNKEIFAEGLQIELTETAVMDNAEHAIRTIKRLRSLGIKVALDDFGKGYSSLSYLSRLPIDKIKVDKDFILGMDEHATNRVITDAIIALGTALQLEVVAEGIESQETLDYVRRQGCRLAQGFYLCRPTSGKMLAASISDGKICDVRPGQDEKRKRS